MTGEILTKAMTKHLLSKYFKDRNIVIHNVKSFNKFVELGLQRVVDENAEVVLDILPEKVKELKIKFGRTWVEKPVVREADGTQRKITPMEARLRSLTYSAPIMIEMSMIKDGVETEKTAVQVGEIPVMLKSKYCYLYGKNEADLVKAGEDPQDPGGYFIINGTERVIVIIEDLAPNKVFVEKKSSGTYPYVAKIFSEDGKYRVPHSLERGKNGIMYVTFTRLKKVPFAVIMRALGVKSDKEMMDMVSSESNLQSDIYINIFEAKETETPKKALISLGRKLGVTHSDEKAVERAEEILDKFFMAHIGQNPENRMDKANFLGRAIKKMLLVSYGILPEDDKDHYANKRLRLPGDSLETLFRFSFKMLVGDMKYNFERLVKRGRIPSLSSVTRSQLLTSRLNSALATGEWMGGQSGVSQHVDRLNYLAMLSHLRRVVSLLTAARENFEARDLHLTHWGKLCSSETPEGPSVGLRKNLAITCEISTECDMPDDKVAKILKSVAGMKIVNELPCDVYINGKLIGSCGKGDEFAGIIRDNRRIGKLPEELNIAYYEKENTVIINTDKGRGRRPLIVAKGGKSMLTSDLAEKLLANELRYNDLVKLGVVEYMDAEEEENAMIALEEHLLSKVHTHLEIGAPVIYGTMASMIPYPEHNLSVRVMIGAKTMKQGIGIYAKNVMMRMDTDTFLLHYPQRPIVTTYIYDSIDYDTHPVGQNLVIAIMSWHGYNMDDAVVFNKSSVERAMYRASYFRPHVIEELRYPGGQLDSIEIPDKDIRGYRTEDVYRLLNDDGIVYPEAIVNNGDVLVGKTSPPRFLTSLEEFKVGVEDRRETSSAVGFNEGGIVDSVILTESESGNKFVSVKIRDEKVPELGDKFSSRHGQKGVIGMLVPQENMPFTAVGIVPDLIFNPHSIPSRMTVGQLIEIIGGKVGALSGEYVDGSAFSSQSEADLRKTLNELGFKENGVETMYDGITGRAYPVKIFVGNAFYLRLKHIVGNKMHARSRGPVQLLTRQPTEGKSKEGGLRLGEMETHCFVAHGAALTLKERFDSDKAIIPVCKNCGLVAIYNRYRKKGMCTICGDDADIAFIEMSYAFKLLLDELKSLSIYPKILVGERS